MPAGSAKFGILIHKTEQTYFSSTSVFLSSFVDAGVDDVVFAYKIFKANLCKFLFLLLGVTTEVIFSIMIEL